MALGTITVVFFCFIIAVIILAFAWFFVWNRKDGICDIFEERENGMVVLIKSNVKYIFRGRQKGVPDSMQISGYKPCKPIELKFAIPFLRKKTDKLYVLRDKEGLFHPMYPTWDPKDKILKLSPSYRDTIDWLVNEFDERDKIKEKSGAMEKLAQYGVPVVMMALLVLGSVYWWQHEERTLNKLQSEKNELDTKMQAVQAVWDPAIVIKASQIIAKEKVVNAPGNWTTTTVNTGLQS